MDFACRRAVTMGSVAVAPSRPRTTTTSPRWRISVWSGTPVGDYYDGTPGSSCSPPRSGRSTASCGPRRREPRRGPALRPRRGARPAPSRRPAHARSRLRLGTAALYLARRRPVDVVGVSNSPAQFRLADRFAGRGGPLQGRVRFKVADFTDPPDGPRGFDLAFAIESFVHADPAAAFFQQAAYALRPGGALVVIDDVRATDRQIPRSRPSRPAGTPRACSPSPRSRRTPPVSG